MSYKTQSQGKSILTIKPFIAAGVMAIYFYKRLAKNSDIGNTPVWVLPNVLRLGRVRDTKFGADVSNEMLLNTTKCQGYRFYRFWVIKGKRTKCVEEGKKLTRILVCGKSLFSRLLKDVSSTLGPLLSSIYLNNLFYLTESTYVCNVADDTTFFACDKDLNFFIKRLEHDSLLAFEWFQHSNMKLNQDECHLLVCEYECEMFWLKLEMKEFGV